MFMSPIHWSINSLIAPICFVIMYVIMTYLDRNGISKNFVLFIIFSAGALYYLYAYLQEVGNHSFLQFKDSGLSSAGIWVLLISAAIVLVIGNLAQYYALADSDNMGMVKAIGNVQIPLLIASSMIFYGDESISRGQWLLMAVIFVCTALLAYISYNTKP